VTTNAARAETLVRALRAGVDGDHDTVRALVTDDVRAWTPAFSTATRDELIAALANRDEAFSDIELRATPLDVGGDFACVEWSVEMTHSGALAVGPDTTIEPTGTRVSVHGITVAEFDAERICSFRQYWDELAMLEQLGLVGA
jgi:ketosteroid isomerase-like protein